MSTGAFSIDQLMELAGLSVSQACKITLVCLHLSDFLTHCIVFKIHPLNKGKRILVACGPGNNGKMIILLNISKISMDRVALKGMY